MMERINAPIAKGAALNLPLEFTGINYIKMWEKLPLCAVHEKPYAHSDQGTPGIPKGL